MQSEILSILPNPQDNIYPWNYPNIEGIVNFYFKKNGIKDEGYYSFILNSGLQINQLEFIAKKIIENLDFFKEKLPDYGRTIRNLMSYGIDALYKELNDLDGSPERNATTIAFFEIVTSRKVVIIKNKK